MIVLCLDSLFHLPLPPCNTVFLLSNFCLLMLGYSHLMQVNVNLAGLPALVLPCGLTEGGLAGLPVGLQMIGPAFDEVQTIDILCIILLLIVSVYDE